MDDQMKQAILQSIEHHEFMQEWVKKQPKEEMPDIFKMQNAINQHWHALYCNLCLIYSIIISCEGCPLYKKYGRCSGDNKKNAWGKLNNSADWEEWLKWDKVLVTQLKSLLEEK